MVKGIVNTAVSMVIIAASSFGFKDDYKPLNVQRDVVSISEIRPLAPSPKSIESQKRKLKKQKLRTKFSGKELRKMGWRAAPEVARKIAWVLVGPLGWRGREWQCLKKLWNEESRWRWHAINRRTGAGGIPQSFPMRKMASAGRDWLHNAYTQIRWGLDYIGGRYETPCNALRFFINYNWY